MYAATWNALISQDVILKTLRGSPCRRAVYTPVRYGSSDGSSCFDLTNGLGRIRPTAGRRFAQSSFHEWPQQVAVGGGLIQRVGPHGVALPWHLGWFKHLGGDHRGGVAPRPRGFWARAAAGLERLAWCAIPCAIARCDGLTRVVTCLSGLDAVGQARSDRGRRPDVVGT
jgi:hypothetical protein